MQLTRVFARPFAWSLFALGAAVAHAACGGAAGSASGPQSSASASAAATATGAPSASASATGSEPTAPASDASWAAGYDLAACHGSGLARCGQHAVDVVDAFDELVKVEDTRDKRAVPIAIEAIHADDAEIVLEGLRIAGRFPREAGVAEAVIPRLDDPRPAIQHMAAYILSSTDGGRALAKQYQHGHDTSASIGGVTPDTHDPVRTPSTWGFPALSNARPYPPGDSPMSLGYSTTASVEEVASFFATQPGAKRMSADDYFQLRKQAAGDPSKSPEMAELQSLQPQLVRNGHLDPAVMKKITDLSKKMQERMSGALDDTPFPANDVLAAGQFVVLTSDASAPSRWVAVYREPAYDRTIAILSWSLGTHPAPMPAPTMIRALR